MRTRQDVYKLGEDWHPLLLWYAKAVAKMKEKDISDPGSWRYQGAIHKVLEGEPPKGQKRFWSQCQHATWYFLPWHRMYLYFFEQIVAKTVSSLGGPNDWTLPYWNPADTANENARILPKAFRDATMPDDGTPNPLRAKRAPDVNAGNPIPGPVGLSSLKVENFIAPTGAGAEGFGGPRTGHSHSGARSSRGALEGGLHAKVHGGVGGLGGWMNGNETAALDPIFWLHHANIDRLWEVWLYRDPNNANPTEDAWLTGLAFAFRDLDGNIYELTPSHVLDTTAAPLFYQYDDVSDPLGGAVDLSTALPIQLSKRKQPPDPFAEMIGATMRPITISDQPVSSTMLLSQPSGPAKWAAQNKPNLAPELVLNFENVITDGFPDSYDVHVNLPGNVNAEDKAVFYAGHLSMFGVREATDPAQDHSANGLTLKLDITDLAGALRELGYWKTDSLQVTMTPVGTPPAEGLDVRAAPVRIGGISLYAVVDIP